MDGRTDVLAPLFSNLLNFSHRDDLEELRE